MKTPLLLSALLLCLIFSSCSKKSTPTPVPATHIIKITGTVNINYEAGATVQKSGESFKTTVDDKMLAAGTTYEFATAALNPGDQVFFFFYIPDIYKSGTVTYTVKDNGVEKMAQANVSFSSLSIQYVVK